MNQELSDYFLQEASSAFAFLPDAHGFAAPQLLIDDVSGFAYVVFRGKNLTVECILDEREGDIDCKVARVIGGTKTAHYAVDEDGVRVREGLASLLRRRGVREPLFRKVGDLDLSQRIRITLQDFAAMLQRHGDDIVGDVATALGSP